MDGVLIIDKPAGMTSHDVVNRVRRILKTKRVGHTGTLDPFATGVLVLLVGKATRLAQFVDKATKEYIADIRFGFSTDTGDLTGKRLSEEQDVSFSVAEFEAVLQNFRGEIEQVPPMYSAKKVDGKKLYEMARKGEIVDRKPASVTILELELIDHDLSSLDKSARIRVVCSAGTYIRTLAEDIGRELGVGAHLTDLKRTTAGTFGLKDVFALSDLESERELAKFLLPIETLVSDLPHIYLSSERIAPTLNGMSTRVLREDLDDRAAVSIFSPEGKLIAVGVYEAAESCIKPRIVLG